MNSDLSSVKWVYRNGHGKHIGPLTSEEMYNLHLRGELPANVTIRRDNETCFRSLVDIAICHKGIPFETPSVVKNGLEAMKATFAALKNLCDRTTEDEETGGHGHASCVDNSSQNISQPEASDPEKSLVSLADDDGSASQNSQDLRIPCKKCDKTFARQAGLKRHIQTVHEGERYPCDFCGSVFMYKESLDRHVKVSHSRIALVCKTCGTRFGNKRSLRIHRRFPCKRDWSQ